MTDCNQKFLYYEKLLEMTEEEVNAYLCGLISANCSVNKSKDYSDEHSGPYLLQIFYYAG